eukprot:3749692-Rhodomonas_salina.1
MKRQKSTALESAWYTVYQKSNSFEPGFVRTLGTRRGACVRARYNSTCTRSACAVLRRSKHPKRKTRTHSVVTVCFRRDCSGFRV